MAQLREQGAVLLRVFEGWLSEIDLGHCANCGGVLKIIAASQEQPAIDSCRASRRGMAVKG